MTTKRTRPPVPPTHYDPQYEALAAQLLECQDTLSHLERRLAALEQRLAVHPTQRNCSKCGRLIPHQGARCGLCGGQAS